MVNNLDMEQLFNLEKAKSPVPAKAKAKTPAKAKPTHTMKDGAVHTGKTHTKDSKVVKPAKATTKKINPWLQHVKDFRSNNDVKGMTVAQVNKEAKKSYTPVTKSKAPQKKKEDEEDDKPFSELIKKYKKSSKAPKKKKDEEDDKPFSELIKKYKKSSKKPAKAIYTQKRRKELLSKDKNEEILKKKNY